MTARQLRVAPLVLAALFLCWYELSGQGIIGGGGGGSGSGSGTVNSGTTPQLSYYASSSTEVSPTPGVAYNATNDGLDFFDTDPDLRVAIIPGAINVYDAGGSTINLRVDNGGFKLNNVGVVPWSSTSAYNGTVDLRLRRSAANTLDVDTGTNDVLANLRVNDITIAGTATIGAGGIFAESLEFQFYNGGSALAGDQQVAIKAPWGCEVQDWELVTDQDGAIVVDLWVDTYANWPPTDADSITASDPPTITATGGTDIKNTEDCTGAGCTSWTTTISAGSWVIANIDSATSATWANLSLQCARQ